MLLDAWPESARVPTANWRVLPKYAAAEHTDDAKVIKILLDAAPESVQQCGREFDPEKWLPLHCASFHSTNEDVVRVLLEAYPKGATAARGWRHQIPLHLAVSKGKINKIRLLLNYTGSVDTRDVNGLTPVDYAGSEDVAALLRRVRLRPRCSYVFLLSLLVSDV